MATPRLGLVVENKPTELSCTCRLSLCMPTHTHTMSCAHVHFSIHVNTCVDWKLIGRCVGLPEADLTAVDGDNRTVEEKRVGMMEK